MGKLVVASSWSICHWDSTQVERMAIHYIDKLVVEWMYDLKGIIVEGDNSNVNEYMQKFKFKELWKQRIDDWEECSWIKFFQQVLFVHTQRRFNMVAHFCAQRALEGSFT
ncbi:hypothetical protein MA16_Dca008392 [Dendrobium catenatum]|uniref:RNase H type-1 domain-containing protein n=1 Tax=Dendrobium catenatum TaxID=906689 RepID=A0A2I0VM35_9ASPA|nr:hypothetical protein MA16_Dca008392 [Dendrobium catenatum]